MKIKITTAEQIILTTFKKDIFFLEPILFEGSLSMLYAPTGQGKSYFALWIAAAVAGGGQFLKWKAPKPRRVLYLDGEMGRREIQKRLIQIASSAGCDIPTGQIAFICQDEQENYSLPYISDFQAQREYLKIIEANKIDVVIIDNYGCSSLLIGRESESQMWARIRSFFLKLRALNKAVILIHHANKLGGQLGSSEKEQVMNWIIKLNPCDSIDYKSGETRFRVIFEKPMRESAREESIDFIAAFRAKDDLISWTYESSANYLKSAFKKMKAARMSDGIIQRALSLSDFQFARCLLEIQREAERGVMPEELEETQIIYTEEQDDGMF